MRHRYVFQAGGKGHRLEVLEVGPQGLRLLAPRRTLIVAAGAAIALAYYVISMALLSPLLRSRHVDPSAAGLMGVLMTLVFVGGPILLGWLASKAFVWIASSWPRDVTPLEFRTIEPHLLTHWICVTAEGKETWLQIAGLRGRVTSALNRTGRGARGDPAT